MAVEVVRGGTPPAVVAYGRRWVMSLSDKWEQYQSLPVATSSRHFMLSVYKKVSIVVIDIRSICIPPPPLFFSLSCYLKEPHVLHFYTGIILATIHDHLSGRYRTCTVIVSTQRSSLCYRMSPPSIPITLCMWWWWCWRWREGVECISTRS